jgi:hypothetical protein
MISGPKPVDIFERGVYGWDKMERVWKRDGKRCRGHEHEHKYEY